MCCNVIIPFVIVCNTQSLCGKCKIWPGDPTPENHSDMNPSYTTIIPKRVAYAVHWMKIDFRLKGVHWITSLYYYWNHYISGPNKIILVKYCIYYSIIFMCVFAVHCNTKCYYILSLPISLQSLFDSLILCFNWYIYSYYFIIFDFDKNVNILVLPTVQAIPVNTDFWTTSILFAFRTCRSTAKRLTHYFHRTTGCLRNNIFLTRSRK